MTGGEPDGTKAGGVELGIGLVDSEQAAENGKVVCHSCEYVMPLFFEDMDGGVCGKCGGTLIGYSNSGERLIEVTIQKTLSEY